MPIILVGLNHRTAPVALRERFSLAESTLDLGLSDLSARKGITPSADESSPFAAIHECVVVSTCNRLEVYTVANHPADALAAVVAFMTDRQGIPGEQLHQHTYQREGRDAVEHLMRVASGLDSMILGESQILGQVAQAIGRAQGAEAAGIVLSQLFARAVHAGRRARSETAISRHTTSVSHAAAHLAKATLGSLDQARVLIVGAGEMAELAATALRAEGAQTITCINRTYANAERLASRFGGRAMNWRHLTDALAEADVIVSATGAPHTVIYRDDVAQALLFRNGKPLVIVDIAVPRDVDVEVDELRGVRRYDIDHLQGAVDASRAQREAAIPEVEAIIRQEADDFLYWLSSRQVVPVLVELRQKAEAIAQIELEHALRHLDGPDARAEHAMALMAHRIIGKLLHEPTVRLKAEAANGNGIVYADTLRELFGLEENCYVPGPSRVPGTSGMASRAVDVNVGQVGNLSYKPISRAERYG